jgi:beta-1,4-mannosyl-glycoprotein beta-1,4-N-acetylglucosaminyltransferase
VKIFDCFMFYNEFDILELRLRELYNHVDVFVIVESDHTNTNRPKPYYFEQAQERYRPWLDKIRYIKHVSSVDPDPWVNTTEQRIAMAQGLDNANDDDIAIVSDVDEIVRASCVDYIRQTNQAVIYGFHMPLFNFKFNYMRVDPGPYDIWSMAARASWIKKCTVPRLRDRRLDLFDLPYEFSFQRERFTTPITITINPEQVERIPHGGWHFGYIGDNAWLLDKAQNTVHQEDNNQEFLDQIDVEKSIKEKKCWNRYWPYQYETVDLTDYFPKDCRLFSQHCLPNTGIDPCTILNNHDT